MCDVRFMFACDERGCRAHIKTQAIYCSWLYVVFDRIQRLKWISNPLVDHYAQTRHGDGESPATRLRLLSRVLSEHTLAFRFAADMPPT